ncbi:SDR family NAD(P)-dependent oxidoreductase [Chitinophagaceae bacterium MMS25-I14]
METLKNKVAIITGGAGSIGKTTAALFLKEGAKVMLVDLSAEALKQAAADLNSENIAWTAADVTKAADVERYAAETVKKFGKIDVFFNNAGIEGVVKPVTEYPEDVFDKVIAVNVKGMWLGCKYVLPQMNDGSSLIITSSVAGIAGTPNVTAYVTSKHAVVGLMRSVALEAAPRKIRVNSIHPSPVDNRMMRSLEEGFAPGHGTEAKKSFETNIPLGRYAQPEEIAQLVLWLASDNSKFITGTLQVIAGGMGA